jgi:site-specific DNA-methyltransferase (adenine-specific)
MQNSLIKNLLNRVTHGDCFDLLPKIPDGSVDLILIDPPYYRVVSEEFDREWKSIEEYQIFVEKLAIEFKRILKANGSFLCFTDGNNNAYSQVVYDKYFKLLNLLVFYKRDGFHNKTISSNKNKLRSFCNSYETCLFYETKEQKQIETSLPKDCELLRIMQELKRKLEAKTGENVNRIEGLKYMAKHYFSVSQFELMKEPVFNRLLAILDNDFAHSYEDLKAEYEKITQSKRYFNDYNDNMSDCQHTTWTGQIFLDGIIHPTQKPLPLIKEMIQKTSRENDLVLDCFSGSGTTAIACQQLNRKFIAIEKDKKYFETSTQRLKVLQSEPDLFCNQNTADL